MMKDVTDENDESRRTATTPASGKQSLIDQIHDLLLPSDASESQSESDQQQQEQQQQEEDSFLYYNERHLAAWVVARRLSPDEFNIMWNRHGNQMIDWSIRMLRHIQQQKHHDNEDHGDGDGTDVDENKDVHLDCCIFRLIVQVLSTSSTSSSTTNSTTPETHQLVQVVLETWKKLLNRLDLFPTKKENETAMMETLLTEKLKLNIDVGNFVLNWIIMQQQQQQHHSNRVSHQSAVIETIWDAFEKHISAGSSLSMESRGSNESSQKEPGQSPSNEYEMMTKLLESIIDDDDLDNQEMVVTSPSLHDTWHQLVINIISLDTTYISEDLASKILLWSVSSSISSENYRPVMKRRFDEWIMAYIMNKCNHVNRKRKETTTRQSGDNTPSKRTKTMVMMYQPTTAAALENLLLAYVVSPLMVSNKSNDRQNDTADDEISDDVMRAMAWQTIASVVETHGWKVWTKKTLQQQQQKKSETTLLSSKPPIVTWAQLAAGEWKIQLEQDLSEHSTEPAPSSVLVANESPINKSNNREILLDGCSRLLMSVVEYLIGLDERPDQLQLLSKNNSIASDYHTSLKILQESLEATLHTTSEYINVIQVQDEQQERQNVLSIRLESKLLVVVSLWSRIFAETDVLSMDNSNIRTEIIKCLKVLLDSGSNIATNSYDGGGDGDGDGKEGVSVMFVSALLPAVTQFLTMLDADVTSQRKMASIVEHNVLPFIDNVWTMLADRRQSEYWLTDNGGASITWACTSVEILRSMTVLSSSSSSKHLASIERKMIEAMKSGIDLHDNINNNKIKHADDFDFSLVTKMVATSLNHVKETFLSLVEDKDNSHHAQQQQQQQQQRRPTPEEMKVLSAVSQIILDRIGG